MSDFIEGWNRGRASATGLGYSENGTPMIGVMLRVNDDPSQPNAGRTITTYLYLSEAAGANSMEALRLMGFKGDDLSQLADESISIEELLPNEVSFPINYEEYQGKSSPKVGKICPAGGGLVMKNKLSGQEAKSFGMRFRALCSSVPAGTQRPAQPKSKSSEPKKQEYPPEEDFPF